MKASYEVIIIGAGISGIGASRELSRHKIPHLILEARNRIGGRIASKMFDGLSIQLGASYVHLPNQTNRILKIIKEQDYKCAPSYFESYQFFYEQKGLVEKKVVSQAENIYEMLMDEIRKKAQSSNVDSSLQQSAVDFFMKLQKEASQQMQSIVRENFGILGCIEGADLKEISAKQYKDTESQQDLVPLKGYSSIVEGLFKECSADIKFEQIVKKIDYSGEIIKVETNKGNYFTRKLISSLPLGILQNNLVQFIPNLPPGHIQALNKIGNGTANKIFVSFHEPFWNIETKWLYFVAKGTNSRYPAALSIIQQNKFMLLFFVSGSLSKQINQLSPQSIRADLLDFLSRFKFEKEIKIKDIQVTKWQRDPFSLGSYSYNKVGTKSSHFETLRSPIDNKIWFVGQHCHPQTNACAHTAFETGIWASEQIINLLN